MLNLHTYVHDYCYFRCFICFYLHNYYISLLKYEERSFRFTNAFTSAGEGSVLEISKRYRHLQHNKRAAAARALKKVQNIDARDYLCNQIMVC